LAVSLGALADIDVPGLMYSLVRSAGADGAEQTTSRLLPLLVLGDVAAGLAPGGEGAVKARAQRLIDRVLSFQRIDGGLSQWSPQGEADLWLTAYVADALTRARAAGFRVAEPPYRRALDWLKQAVDNAWIVPDELPGRAFAYLTLARVKAVDAPAVRFFQEAYWDKLPTDMARGQVAGALAALGEGNAGDAGRGGYSRADERIRRGRP
jgi:uncharacterized protein YfaS (alpha-2-macroglobulin family)